MGEILKAGFAVILLQGAVMTTSAAWVVEHAAHVFGFEAHFRSPVTFVKEDGHVEAVAR